MIVLPWKVNTSPSRGETTKPGCVELAAAGADEAVRAAGRECRDTGRDCRVETGEVEHDRGAVRAREFPELGGGVLVHALDRVVRAELLRNREAVWVHVDRDDGRSRQCAHELDRECTEPSRADDHGGGSCAEFRQHAFDRVDRGRARVGEGPSGGRVESVEGDDASLGVDEDVGR